MSYAAVAVGGAIGAVARYAVSGLAHGRFGVGFPYGTLLVNTVGCFLLALVIETAGTRYIVHPGVKLFLTVGVLGGFTTFSTYSYETLSMARDGMFGLAALNAFGSLALGLLGAYAGMVVGRLL
ncbi:Fluoride ion transporter CrcB [hydrothermal vent metagenome]|uniref:Fluoride ion transporter CrcB n=1 Tax=hydrothermal vent metagenome TaxID=652676 RepID=A0A3B1C7I0_9ZZZZ